MMGIMEPGSDATRYDDPRRLRDLLTRAADLAERHGLRSVLVGLSGFEGDVVFPEIVRYVESALRVDDSVFRMTRERALLLLTDVDEKSAAAILTRTLEDFREHIDINLAGVFVGSKAYVRHLRRVGKSGVLLNVSSGAAWNAYAGWVHTVRERPVSSG